MRFLGTHDFDFIHFTSNSILIHILAENLWLTALFGGHSPTQRQNTNSKKLTIENLSKSGLQRYTKFGQANSNDERKITLSLILHFIWDFRI